MKKSWTINNLDELQEFAQALVGATPRGRTPGAATILTLTGDLGAGKTTLTQLVGKELGVTEKINSPTFVVSKQYPLQKKALRYKTLVHIDAYRLEDENLEPLGFDDIFTNPDNLVVIEWPNLIEHALPPKRTDISITYDPVTEVRNITVK